MPKKVLPLTSPSWSIFFYEMFVLLFLKLFEIQRGRNWLNFSGHVHLGTRSRDMRFPSWGHFRSKVMDESLKYM